MKEFKLSPLKKILFELIKLSKRDIEKRFRRAGVNITQLQYWVLVFAKPKPKTINEIAEKLNIKPPSLTPVVDFLETNGLVLRRHNLKDRRKIQLFLTQKGHKLIEKIPLNDKKDGLEISFSKLNSSSQKELINLLERLVENFPK